MFSISHIQKELDYSGPGFAGAWLAATGEPLPNNTDNVQPDALKSFLSVLATPKAGRARRITEKAAELLQGFADQKIETVFGEPQNPDIFQQEVEQRVLKMNQRLDAIQQGFKEPEKTCTTSDAPTTVSGFSNFSQNLKTSKLSVIFWGSVFTAFFGFCYVLGFMGFCWGVIYLFAMWQALDMAGNRESQRTANTGLFAVWIMEIISFFIHQTMFNMATWNAAAHGKLPLIVDGNSAAPFWIATVFAALFSMAGVYAVTVKYRLMIEKIEAEQYAETYQKQY